MSVVPPSALQPHGARGPSGRSAAGESPPDRTPAPPQALQPHGRAAPLDDLFDVRFFEKARRPG